MSTHKLQPICAAIDSHQYQRGIKLCLALPPTLVIGQALLANCYARSGQRLKSLTTLQNILGKQGFPELQLEIQYSMGRRQELAEKKQHKGDAAVAAKKSGKKGKKKPPMKAPPKEEDEDDLKDFDWIDQLDCPPVLPENWPDALPDGLPPVQEPMTDDEPDLLSTISVTLTSQRLVLTAHQVYAWGIAASRDMKQVRKALLLGLQVWMSPQYPASVTTPLLSELQVLALQLARLQQEQLGWSPATAWAAQIALWQLHMFSENEKHGLGAVDDKKAAMLPRLAESLALKAAQLFDKREDGTGMKDQLTEEQLMEEQLMERENFMLYMRALDFQSKWEEKLVAIQNRLENLQKSSNPREEVLRDWKATCLSRLGNNRNADVRAEMAYLLRLHPDQWSNWKMHLDHDDTENLIATLELIQEVGIPSQNEAEKEPTYPLRGPPLARIERCAILHKADSSCEKLVSILQEMQSYGNSFANRASCTFNDLSLYLKYVLEQQGSMETAVTLLEWITSFRSVPKNQDAKERRKELRGYIFGIQATYQILVSQETLREKYMPDWKEILQVWKDFQQFEVPPDEQAQKEHHPADELVLLATQQLTQANCTKTDLVMAATILDAAIEYSPHNAYLKIAAMFVYADLDAVERSFELFGQLHIKHIQNESCVYLILPLLHAGGLYHELLLVAKELNRLQYVGVRDAAEFTSKAMENGALEKAQEFIFFQRERMNKSLTTVEARGLVLDCAPMFQYGEGQDIGSIHGIVGGPEDTVRAHSMISEAHNPIGAFHLLGLRGKPQELLDSFTENRDFNILPYISLLHPRPVDTKEQILSDTMRRCHFHNILIRSALCLDATKGPKKGKVTKSSEELLRRCASLQAYLEMAQEFGQDDSLQTNLNKSALTTVIWLCRALLVVSGGVSTLGDNDNDKVDSLKTRETAAVEFMNHATATVQTCHEVFTATKSLEANRMVPVVSKFLLDSLVSTFALFQMCGTIFELFGWGKRKRETRQLAGALATFSISLRELVVDMQNELNASLPMSLDYLTIPDQDVIDLVQVQHVNATAKRITHGQLETMHRINAILTKIIYVLQSFDVEMDGDKN